MKKRLLLLILFSAIAATGHAQTHRSTLAGLENRSMEKNIALQRPDLLPNAMNEQEMNPMLPESGAASVVQVYDSIYYWQWDTLANTWDAQPYGRKKEFLYDPNNNMVSNIYQSWEGNSWSDFTRVTYTYDANNNQLSLLQETWNGIAWVNAHRETSTYDNNNNELTRLGENWNVNVWVSSTRWTFTYDPSNNLLSQLIEQWDGSALDNFVRYTYGYDINDNMVSNLQENWFGSEWYNSYRYTSTYDFDNNRVSQLTEDWNGSAWVNFYLDTYTYDPNNNLLSTLRKSWDGSAWGNFYRITSSYDSNDNLLTRLSESWIDANWATFFDNRYTYSADDFQESHAYWHWQTGTLLSGDSTHNYFHTTTGIGEQNAGLTLLAYPNPSNGLFHIKMEGACEYRVFDAMGRLVLARGTSGNTSIDLSTQPKGIYTLQLHTDSGSAIRKLVKE